ncbi:MAG: hypothetical protein EBQ92_13975 [Proteobacteria bacterium]|nr:hypothetical protein [Pseudomonadota bacterium]
MRKILFLVLILSAVGMGWEHAKPPIPTNKPDEKNERKEGEGLSEKTSDVLGSATDLEQNLDNPDFKKKIEVLSPDEKEELRTEVENRKLEAFDSEQKKRFDFVLDLLDQKEKEETLPSTASSKPTSTPLQTTGGKVIGKNGKVDVYKLPGGFEVHLDPQGRKTIDGQPLVVVGKEGATMMDGLFPASAFGLQVGTKGEISIDPKPSTLTVSGSNGPKINSAVPVIFNDKGDAFARQSMLDEKGNQTLYWANGSGDYFKSEGKAGGDIVTVSKTDLPQNLEPKGSGNGQYLTVRATTQSEPERLEPNYQILPFAGTPNISMDNSPQLDLKSPLSPPPAAQDPMAAFTQRMQEYSKAREMLAPATSPAPEGLRNVSGAPSTPQEALANRAVSQGPCIGGRCPAPAQSSGLCVGGQCGLTPSFVSPIRPRCVGGNCPFR